MSYGSKQAMQTSFYMTFCAYLHVHSLFEQVTKHLSMGIQVARLMHIHEPAPSCIIHVMQVITWPSHVV